MQVIACRAVAALLLYGTAAGAAAPAVSAPRPASNPVVRSDAIDDYLQRELVARRIPGLAVAVVRHGKVQRVSTYGTANLETGTPVTPDSLFAVASLDKGITATGVLKASELGKLALTDPISKYVDVPLPGVNLMMLLSHTAGLEDLDQIIAEKFGSKLFQQYSTGELLAAVATASRSPPGVQYSYSDAGLFLAQLAIERATGKPWLEWMQESLFRPAGMLNVVTLDPHAIVPHRVSSYTFDDGQQLIRDDRTDVDYGSLYNDLGMTVGDFARWLILLDGHGALSEASIKTLWTGATFADGAPAREVYSFSGYGLGFGLDEVLGQRVILHTGHSGVAYVKFPALDLAVVVFTNLEHPKGSDPAGLALGVAGLLEPSISLRALSAAASGEPPSAASLRRAYEDFLAGAPELSIYSPSLQITMWHNRDTFLDRSPRLGSLVSWTFLRQSLVDGESAFLFRAAHTHGEVYVRFSMDARGKISRLVWWHL
jgi:CubicO group peptidase (beta-lactamase class C family)